MLAIENDDDTEDAVEVHQAVLMCVLWRNGSLGAAYYDCFNQELYIIQDTVDINPDFILTHTIMSQIQPKFILSIGSQNEKFIQVLSEIVSESDDDNLTSSKLQLLPAKEYSLGAATSTVSGLKLPQLRNNATEEETIAYLQSIINFEQKISIHALGALIMFLNKHWHQLEVTSPANAARPVQYLNINLITLKNLVFIAEDTYKGLQIFKPKQHPANFKRCFHHNNVVEGLSLFKLFDRCKTKMGSLYLRQMMYFPTNDIKVLRKRHQFIEFCLRPINHGIVKNLVDSIKHVPYIHGIVAKLQSVMLAISDWKKLLTTVSNVLMIYEICEAYMRDVDLFQEFVQSIDQNLYLMLFAITKTVQFNKKECFVIKEGVDRLLDAKKGYYMELHNKITTATNCEVAKMPDFVTKCCIVYIPEIGYLVYVIKWADTCSEYDLEPFGFQFKFKIDKSFYYKSATCVELDNCLGDIHKDIETHESRILYRLSKYVFSLSHFLFKPIKIVYEIDCLISFAEVADNFNYVKPELSEEKDMFIERSRHPLAELNLDNFVANDYRSSNSSNRVKIITGPNSCGKSVYLKQVAIIAYMAHIGSYVPAKSATISMLNSIHTRMNSCESTAFKHSAFMNDLRQISQSVIYSMKSSLIVIDEFGKGTSELDGKALLASVIGHFINRDEYVPNLIISTHFLDIPKLIAKSDIVNYYTFENCLNENGNVVFLYKLIEGTSDFSLALQVANTSNLDNVIIQRAAHFIANLKSNRINDFDFRDDDNNLIFAVIFNYEKLFQTLLSLQNPTIEQMSLLLQKACEISIQ